MAKTTSEIISIVAAGGSIIINQKKTTADLISIAAVAKKSGAKLIMKQKKTTSDMISIAKAGGGNVSFEI
jgi:antitoxin (DNA-binding transcriptional repressor) of toxin-antitoxin stability system